MSHASLALCTVPRKYSCNRPDVILSSWPQFAAEGGAYEDVMALLYMLDTAYVCRKGKCRLGMRVHAWHAGGRIVFLYDQVPLP